MCCPRPDVARFWWYEVWHAHVIALIRRADASSHILLLLVKFLARPCVLRKTYGSEVRGASWTEKFVDTKCPPPEFVRGFPPTRAYWSWRVVMTSAVHGTTSRLNGVDYVSR